MSKYEFANSTTMEQQGGSGAAWRANYHLPGISGSRDGVNPQINRSIPHKSFLPRSKGLLLSEVVVMN